MQRNLFFILLSFLCLLASCGKSDSKSAEDINLNAPPTQNAWLANVFNSEWRSLRGQCETSTQMNEFQRHLHNDVYLWYDEITDRDPAAYDDIYAYFDLMKTNEKTPSGRNKDRYHWHMDAEEWTNYTSSGEEFGYGARYAIVQSSVPRKIIVAYAEENSPAQNAGMIRGVEIIEIDGELVENGSADILNAALFPNNAETHTFKLRGFGSNTDGSEDVVVDITSAVIEIDPLPKVKVIEYQSMKIGYILLNSFSIQSAEKKLIDAINELKSQEIDELIVDLRYNGGGYTDISNQFAFMVSGNVARGKVYSALSFNSKYPSQNPITGATLSPTLFHTETLGFSVDTGSELPFLNLSSQRIYILTKSSTASASEAFINGLRGIDFDVRLIGEETQGKPYGYYPIENCGRTYFTIQFKNENEKGFGQYSDGFSPKFSGVDDISNTVETPVEGCLMKENFNSALGEVDELLLQTTLNYISSGVCEISNVQQRSLKNLSTDLNSQKGALRPSQFNGMIEIK